MTQLSTQLFRPFPSSTRLALDLETTGLDPLTDDIITITVSDGESAVVFDVRTCLPYGKCNDNGDDTFCDLCVYDWLHEHIFDRRIVAHNAAFDLAFLREKYAVEYPENVWDTLLAEQLLTAGLMLPAGLKDVAHRRLELELDKSLQTSFTRDGELTPEQIDYASYDVTPLIEIAEQQLQEIRKLKLGRVWDIECRALPVFTEMSRVGVLIDRSILDPLLADATIKRDALLDELQFKLTPHVQKLRVQAYDDKIAPVQKWLAALAEETARLEDVWQTKWDDPEADYDDGWIFAQWQDDTIDKTTGHPKGKKRYVKAQLQAWRQANPRPPKPHLDESPINLNSPQQVLAALGELGLELSNLQGKTLQAELADAPARLRDEILSPLLSYKKLEKLVSAFGERLIEKISVDGRIRGGWRQYGTATGRPSCSNPNLLQMPNNQSFRSVFRAGEDKLFVVADYSQMELRILAQLSGDLKMRTAFAEGLDLHTYTASLMFGVPFEAVADKQRKLAKTINFGIVYGMGPSKLRQTLAADGIIMSSKEAWETLENWKRTYPDAARWIRQQGDHAQTHLWVATALGRKRFFTLADDNDEGEKGAIRRRGGNHPVQGGNADVTKLAMVLINEHLAGRGTIVMQVYDEIVVEVDQEVADVALELVRTSMEMAARTILTTVPVAVDAVISTSWSEADALVEEVALAG